MPKAKLQGYLCGLAILLMLKIPYLPELKQTHLKRGLKLAQELLNKDKLEESFYWAEDLYSQLHKNWTLDDSGNCVEVG